MATIDLTKSNFMETIEKSSTIIVDFWAPWCGPCRAFGPIFKQAAERNPDVVFAKLNTEEEQELAGSLGIRSIPTVMIFREGILIFSQPGMLPKEAIDDLLKQARALDMVKVRQEVEDKRGKTAKRAQA